MTEKRYFINSLQNIEDRLSGVILCGFSQIVERLNEYDEKYSQLFTEYSELQVENEQLKQDRNEMFIRERDTKNELRDIKYENEKLRQEIKEHKAVINKEWNKYLKKHEMI